MFVQCTSAETITSNPDKSITMECSKFQSITWQSHIQHKSAEWCFDVPTGSVFGILGPNGSGKTTLLGIVMDVLRANSGNFLWFGKPAHLTSEEISGPYLKHRTSTAISRNR